LSANTSYLYKGRHALVKQGKLIEGSLRQIDRSGYLKIPLKQYWNLLVEYLKPQRSCVAMLGIALLSSIGLNLNPQILRYFIDTAVAGGSEQDLVRAALCLPCGTLDVESEAMCTRAHLKPL